MSQAIRELTAALQELTRQETSQLPLQQPLPEYLDLGTLVIPPSIQSFVQERRAYEERTRNVNAGMY